MGAAWERHAMCEGPLKNLCRPDDAKSQIFVMTDTKDAILRRLLTSHCKIHT